MNRTQKVVQLIGDVGIPLIGFLFWDWSLYFILLFYFIDLIGREVFAHIKARRIVLHQNKGKDTWIKWGALSTLLLLFSLGLTHLAMTQIQPGIHFGRELQAFWNYTEMGIAQGYILVPLVVFASYQQYKMTFLMPARYRNMPVKEVWMLQLRNYFFMLAGAGLALGIAVLFRPTEEIFVALLLLGITAISILGSRK